MSNQQCIIITGASDGLGKAIAIKCAKAGVTLALIARSPQKLRQVSHTCSSLGANVHTLSCDLSQNHQKFIEWLINFDSKYPVDTVIANAAITANSSLEGKLESWETTFRLFNTNILGVVSTLHPLVEKMQSRRKGHLVIVSSLAAYYGMPITPAYCASKAAIKSYGESLRCLLKKDNLTVSIVLPGFIHTKMSQKFRGHKVFMLNVDQAANTILNKAVDKKKAIVSFPFPLNIGMKLLTFLPVKLADYIMVKLYGQST